MKEIAMALVIILILVGFFRYNSNKVEEDVRIFCESIQADKLSYEEIIVLSRNNEMEIEKHDDNLVVDSEKDSIIETKIYKHFGMAYLSCFVKHKNKQIIDIKFVADWGN